MSESSRRSVGDRWRERKASLGCSGEVGWTRVVAAFPQPCAEAVGLGSWRHFVCTEGQLRNVAGERNEDKARWPQTSGQVQS